MPAQPRKRRGFGQVRKLPSGRFQASYVGPDGARHLAQDTFDTHGDADTWLAGARTDIARDEWHRPIPAKAVVPTFGDYADAWLTVHKLRPRTRAEYRKLLDGHLRPTFGDIRLDDITPAQVRVWHARLATTTGPTRQAHAYGLLRTVCNVAVADDVIVTNPCRVKGAGRSKRARWTDPATLAELDVITAEMREEYAAAIPLAAWCAMRFGEVAELRRGDLDLDAGVVRITRAVTFVDGKPVVGPPKSEAGIRDVAIPPHVVPILAAHLRDYVGPTQTALVFPSPTGGQLRSDGRLHRDFHAARLIAGRPDLRFHDLRHTGGTSAAITGATLKELMRRLGHSTVNAAMIYQHATDDRDAAIAAALSEFANAKVVELRPRTLDTAR